MAAENQTTDDTQVATTDVRAMEKARLWRADHRQHVLRLAAADDTAYPPTGSDLMRPELWKGAHWRWLAAHFERIA